MKITVIGRGNVGGGLAARWRRAGHDVTELGKDGGDGSDADVVVVAVPSSAIADALGKVSGIGGKTTIDATNARGARDESFPSQAHQVQSIVGGPTAKAFNLNFARIYDEIDAQRARPSNLFAADDDAREAAEQLIRDAGYDPVYAGGLDQARVLEEHLCSDVRGQPGRDGPILLPDREAGRPLVGRPRAPRASWRTASGSARAVRRPMVALASPTDVLVAADTPQEVLAWLAKHDRRAPYGMFRVPETVAESEGMAPF